jgi:hypothetical protein
VTKGWNLAIDLKIKSKTKTYCTYIQDKQNSLLSSP